MHAEIASRRGASRQERASASIQLRADPLQEQAMRGARAGVPIYLQTRSPLSRTANGVERAGGAGGDVAARVSQPGDAQEQEADRVAERIARMPLPVETGDVPSLPASNPVAVARAAAHASAPVAAPPIVHDTLRSSGRPLDAGARAYFEPRFGKSFEQVRVHTDGRSAASARALGAVAYASGRDIVFDSNRYQPESASGRHLLGHELTHVLQQAQGGSAHVVQRMFAGPPETEEVETKKFTAEEYQWIADVWSLPEIEMLFAAFDKVPDPVLHRVSSLGGAEGSIRDTDISIADLTYENRETYVNDAGAPVKATREQAFKGTLLHELLHFFFNQTEHLKKVVTPKILQSIMIEPTKVGHDPAMFGWFQHPESKLVFHLDMEQTRNFSWVQAYIDPASDLGKIQAKGAYEHSPMPQSGDAISPEEDLAAVTALYLTSKESRNTLKAHFPKRYDLISGYFETVLPKIIEAKRQAENAN